MTPIYFSNHFPKQFGDIYLHRGHQVPDMYPSYVDGSFCVPAPGDWYSGTRDPLKGFGEYSALWGDR